MARAEKKRPSKRPLPSAKSTLVMAPLLLVLGAKCHAFGPEHFSHRFSLELRAITSPPSSSVVSSSANEDGESSSRKKFMYMTEEEDQLLKEKGDLEEGLMQTPTALQAMKLTGLPPPSKSKASGKGMGGGGFGGGGGGFGAKKGGKGKKKKKPPKQRATPTAAPAEALPKASPEVLALTQAIREDGLVRIDNVLGASQADGLREYLIDLRKRAREDVESGAITDSQQRFADVLLNQNRCDLKIPLGPKPVHEALLDLLNDNKENLESSNTKNDESEQTNPSLVRQVIEGVFEHYPGSVGSQASLWELNCFMSNSGARRQLVHADCVCLDPVPGLDHTDTNSDKDPAGEPILLTCFVALQDIDPSMGPTVFMPQTHNIRSHNVFFETGRDKDSTPQAGGRSPKNELLRKSKSLVGAPLPKGSCIVFDPRVLHCAGANVCEDPDHTRALFYMTFKNPKVDSPGCPSTSGYGIANADLTLSDLVTDLLWMEEGIGQGVRRIPLLAAAP